MQQIARLVIFIALSLPLQLFAQSEATLIFLTLQPSARLASMGNASVASATHEPFDAYFNPAHLGMAAFENQLKVDFALRRELLANFFIDSP